MNLDTIKVVADIALLPVIALLGWLVKRVVSGIDKKLADLGAELKRMAANVVEHEKQLAVHTWRLDAIEKRRHSRAKK